MIIRVLEDNYLVLRTVAGTGMLTQYECRRASDDENRIYRITAVPHEMVAGEFLSCLAELREEGSFRELRDYTSDGTRLLIVMDCGTEEAEQIAEFLREEDPSLDERLDAAGKIIERLILSALPPYFVYAALCTGQPKVTPALDICFDFDLTDLAKFGSISIKDAMNGVSDVLELIFAKEKKKNALPELTSLIRTMRDGEKKDFLEVHQEFLRIREQYAGKETTELENRSPLFRLWACFKWLCAQLKKLAYLAILALAVAYLVISVRNFFRPTAAKDVYPRIGDEIIISGTEASAHE